MAAFVKQGIFAMMNGHMGEPLISKILFTITFPSEDVRAYHVPRIKLHSLARNQLPDMDVIETIDHLFRCQRCFENYRRVRNSYVDA